MKCPLARRKALDPLRQPCIYLRQKGTSTPRPDVSQYRGGLGPAEGVLSDGHGTLRAVLAGRYARPALEGASEGALLREAQQKGYIGDRVGRIFEMTHREISSCVVDQFLKSEVHLGKLALERATTHVELPSHCFFGYVARAKLLE